MKNVVLMIVLALLFLPITYTAGASIFPTVSSVSFSPQTPSSDHVVDVVVEVEWNDGNVSGVSFTTCSGAMCGIPIPMEHAGDGVYTVAAGPFEPGTVEFTFIVSHDQGDDVIYIQNLTIGGAKSDLIEEGGGIETLFMLVLAASAIGAGAVLFFLHKRTV